MSIWNDTFIINIIHSTNNFHGTKSETKDKFQGSLKGAIRYTLNKYGNIQGYHVISFYNSKGEWLKEISF